MKTIHFFRLMSTHDIRRVLFLKKKKLNQNAKAACKKLLIQLPVQSALAVRS